MKKCPKCGAQMPDDTNFCTECGTDLRDVVINDEKKQMTETFKPDGTVKQSQDTMQHQASKKQSNKRSLDTKQAKQTATSYWKWLLGSWTHPTALKSPASKWFGVGSIVIETLLFCMTFFALVQRVISYINRFAGNTVNTLASLLGNQSQNTGNLINFNAFGTSFELFIVLILLNAAVLGAVYGIDCWVFKEKEKFFDFINRFAHYTNVILIANLVLFILGLASTSYQLILIVLVASALLYILGMTMTVTTRQGSQRMDRFYGAIFVILIILIAFVILTSICGNSFEVAMRAFTGGLGN